MWETVWQRGSNLSRSGLPVSVGLMHVLMAAESMHQARTALTQTHTLLEDDAAARRLAELIQLWDETPQARELVKRVLACVRHDNTGQTESIVCRLGGGI